MAGGYYIPSFSYCNSFLDSGHMYRTNRSIAHNIKDILKANKGPFMGHGHNDLYEILTKS